jgi:hypothetical protein
VSLVIYCADFSRVHKKFKYDVSICLTFFQTGGNIDAVTQHLILASAQLESAVQDAAGSSRVSSGMEHNEDLLAKATFGPLFPNRQGTERHGIYLKELRIKTFLAQD